MSIYRHFDSVLLFESCLLIAEPNEGGKKVVSIFQFEFIVNYVLFCAHSIHSLNAVLFSINSLKNFHCF